MSQTGEVATLGGGCFWCLEAVYLGVEGVNSVESGYAGGETQRPTYEQVCDGATGHAEVVKVDFDPAKISYREILDIFFAIHDPTQLNRQGNDVGTQYRSVIFTHSDAQRETALQAIREIGEQVSTTARSSRRYCRSTATTGRPRPIIRTILRSIRIRATARSWSRRRSRSFARSSLTASRRADGEGADIFVLVCKPRIGFDDLARQFHTTERR